MGANARAEERVERFARELAAVGGRAVLVESPQKAVEALVERLRALDAREVLLAPSPWLAELNVVQALRDASFVVRVLGDDADESLEKDELKRADVGVTGALAAVAESGTLLLGGRVGGGWHWASLVPPVHVALLEAEQIVGTLDEAFARLKRHLARGLEEFVWITGPSRTADIAQTLFLGMHGPRELHVLIVSSAP